MVILGVTSMSGAVAIEMCRHLGAGKVIGIARDAAKLSLLREQLDVVIQLQEEVAETDYSVLGEVDVVLDYVYGEAAAGLLGRLEQRKLVQYVQIGCLGGLDMNLPGKVLRSRNLVIRGAGPGSWSFTQLGEELAGLVEATAKLGKRNVKEHKLEYVERLWGEKGEERIVYVP